MSAPELVDAVEVVGRDDEMVKLAQVAQVIGQVVPTVIMHGGLAPHTPGGGGQNTHLAVGRSSGPADLGPGPLERPSHLLISTKKHQE